MHAGAPFWLGQTGDSGADARVAPFWLRSCCRSPVPKGALAPTCTQPLLCASSRRAGHCLQSRGDSHIASDCCLQDDTDCMHLRRPRRSCTIRQTSTGSCQSAQDSPLKRYSSHIPYFTRLLPSCWPVRSPEQPCSWDSCATASHEKDSEIRLGMQIDEDTDRDRYMSPLEAKQYGLIDHVIGGDEAGFKARLSFSLSKAAACCA